VEARRTSYTVPAGYLPGGKYSGTTTVLHRWGERTGTGAHTADCDERRSNTYNFAQSGILRFPSGVWITAFIQPYPSLHGAYGFVPERIQDRPAALEFQTICVQSQGDHSYTAQSFQNDERCFLNESQLLGDLD
jgi:hypothetical protein